jgi:hypothetical protein
MGKAFKSLQDVHEVMIYTETGQWLSGVEEEAEIKRAFVQKYPELLLKVPENQELFTKSELDELLPLAKQALRESDG